MRYDAAEKPIVLTYWLITLGLFLGTMGMVFFWTPEEATMGTVQKIFYFHLPVAINTFLACATVFAAGAGYLVTRNPWWDDLAAAAAKIAVILATGVLISGMLWRRGAGRVVDVEPAADVFIYAVAFICGLSAGAVEH